MRIIRMVFRYRNRASIKSTHNAFWFSAKVVICALMLNRMVVTSFQIHRHCKSLSLKRILIPLQNTVSEVGSGDLSDKVDLSSLTVVKLKAILRDLGLPVIGKKQDLIERIQHFQNLSTDPADKPNNDDIPTTHIEQALNSIPAESVFANIDQVKDEKESCTSEANSKPNQKSVHKSAFSRQGIQLLVSSRIAARKLKQFSTADWIKQTLEQEGVELKDDAESNSTKWKSSSKFTRDAPEGGVSTELLNEIVRLRAVARLNNDYETADSLKAQLEECSLLLFDNVETGKSSFAHFPLDIATETLRDYLEYQKLPAKGRRDKLYQRVLERFEGDYAWDGDEEVIFSELRAFSLILEAKRKFATEVVECPPELIGRVIGKGGAMIEELQKKSGCHFQIAHDTPEFQNRDIIIKGAPESVQAAKQMLLDVMEKKQEYVDPKKRRQPRGSTNIISGASDRKRALKKQSGDNEGNQWFKDNFTGTRVFVTNIPFECKWTDLKDHFMQAGNVVYASISEDGNGTSKGCGIVQFETTKEAQKAIEELDFVELMDRPLGVRADLQQVRRK